MSSACLYLLVVVFSLLSLFFNSHGSKANFLASQNCPITSCTHGPIFHYPFWKMEEDSPADQYCGYPGFGLKCSSTGEPIFDLPNNDSYYVKDINFILSTVTLVDIDVVDQECPRAKHSISVGKLPFDYSPLDVNLSFHFNCSFNIDPAVPPITCLGLYGTKKSYVFTEGEEPGGFAYWSENCDENVVVTVTETEEITRSMAELTGAFGVAMNNGFVLNWTTGKECDLCETNGGFCGYNDSALEVLCFCKDGSIGTPSNGLCKSGTKFNLKFKIVLGLCSAVGTILLFIFGFGVKHRISVYKEANSENVEAFIQNIGPLAVKRYKFSAVRKITNSFKDKLGQGGYGDVYKGHLLDGFPVAVKVLKESKGNGDDFVNEVASISRTSHVNVVTLLGYCFEGKKKALIYEFMPNGSLEKFIYKDSNPLTTPHLALERLNQIAIGIARGLEYLHRGCNTRILHFDIKPHNILLDENFSPKISDFGLSKLCTRKESIISMLDARGTIGYIAPEVFSRNFGRVSAKSDVYSYGMMILEMVGGRKNIDARVSHTSEIYFPDWVYVHLEQGSNFGLLNVVTEEEKEIVKKMILVGMWCIQTRPSDRPSMSKVIEMLEGSIEALQIPPKPVLSSPVRSSPPESTAYSTLI